jgi:DNA-binding transcriptional regulator GbsR (MarR family)
MDPNTHLIEFSQFTGEMAESLSFNKSIGQIYGLLFISPEPLSLEEIAKRLSMSKGNASINLRVLEDWGAVRPTSVQGSRRDYYQANHDLKEIATRRLKEGFGRRLDRAEEALNRMIKGMDDQPQQKFTRQKVEELRTLISRGRKAFDMLPTLLGFL